jgi:fatty acid desaturase
LHYFNLYFINFCPGLYHFFLSTGFGFGFWIRFYFIYFLLLCWGYIVTFTKVLISNIPYHPLHHSPSPITGIV